MNATIVAVSNNRNLLDSIVGRLADRKVDWTRIPIADEVPDAIGDGRPDLVIVDASGGTPSHVLGCIGRLKDRWPGVPVFLMTCDSSEALAIGALRAGADDYFKAPFSTDEIIDRIDRTLRLSGHMPDRGLSSKRLRVKLVGGSRVMEELRRLIERVADVDSTVLITGETGTGKELAAGLIHGNSARAKRSLVSVNCAALPDSLVESELFGHERGAFTGAASMSRGRFEQAHGGTLFLDEIGDMTAFAQAKILRVIEDKKIARLGGAAPIPLDFRLIAATNRPPEELMETGDFRDDLFYRLNVVRVHMPSLRKHREDIPTLVAHGIRQLNRKFNRTVRGLSSGAMKALKRHSWPGNVRELMNLLEAAYINMPAETIRYADLPDQFHRCLDALDRIPDDERAKVLSALMATNWNKSTAAKKLNWSRMTLYRKMAKHRIVEKRKPR